MSAQISVQLYSIREHTSADFDKAIRRIADMGFTNVEPAGYPGTTPAQAAKLFQELNLKAPSCHGALPIGENANEIIETALMMGHQYIFTGCPTNFKEDFSSRDRILKTAERYCEAAEIAAKHGIQVGYHNHDWDLIEVDGEYSYKTFLQNTPESVLWEADLFWVSKAGLDTAEFVKEIGTRGKCLHFKDGIVRQQDNFKEEENESGKVMVSDAIPFRPAGQGEVQLKKAFEASEHVEYVVVELDSYEGDMMQAVQESYTYLTQQGWGKGRI